MKTLILKELRENLMVAVVMLLLSVAVVAGTQLYYIDLIRGIASGISDAGSYSYRLQPLASDNFKVFSLILCCLTGAVLGWVQIHNERHRDLWAFLAHRPVTRTTIFWSKVAAGLIIYAVTVGLPLAYFVWWDQAPGNVAALFEWTMTWPPLAAFIAGAAWYFAGMLTSIRQARWYGSRTLAVGAALICSFAGYNQANWWLVAALTMILAVAVWGAFHNRGQFQGQPMAGKAALTLSLMPGAIIIFLMIWVLVTTLGNGINHGSIWPHYAQGRNGVVYKITEANGGARIVSIDGEPLKNPKTGGVMGVDEFDRDFLSGGVIYLAKERFYRPQESKFGFLWGDKNTLWFVRNQNEPARITGYDVQTRRLAGSVGPNGFAQDKTGDGSIFLPHHKWLNWGGQKETTMASSNAIYSVDFENRTVKSIWTVAGNDVIYGSGHITFMEGSSIMVFTRQQMVFFSSTATNLELRWKLPISYPGGEYVWAEVHEFNPTNEVAFSVWLGNSEDSARSRVIWLSGKGAIQRQVDLSAIKEERKAKPIKTSERIMSALFPPALTMSRPIFSEGDREIDWHRVRVDMAWSGLCLPVILWLGRRYRFSTVRMAVWILFVLVFGWPGVLVFLAVQEWPARERCASCGKLRLVDREKCEHCEADFPAPKRNGTEIFEVLETV